MCFGTQQTVECLPYMQLLYTATQSAASFYDLCSIFIGLTETFQGLKQLRRKLPLGVRTGRMFLFIYFP